MLDFYGRIHSQEVSHYSVSFLLADLECEEAQARIIIINREAETRIPSLIRDYMNGIRPLPSFDTAACIARYGL